jgi:hypothetical protein
MADHSSRRRDDRLSSTEGEVPADEQSAGDGVSETLAEKIHRFRQPGPGASGGAPGPNRVVRHPREE